MSERFEFRADANLPFPLRIEVGGGTLWEIQSVYDLGLEMHDYTELRNTAFRARDLGEFARNYILGNVAYDFYAGPPDYREQIRHHQYRVMANLYLIAEEAQAGNGWVILTRLY